MEKIIGLIDAPFTPFYENGEVNYEEFAKQIELQIAGETDAIIVCGTTGEASTLGYIPTGVQLIITSPLMLSNSA